MIEALKKQHPDVPGLNAQELSQMLKAKESSVVVVDVRSSAEREVSTVNGAISKDEYENRQKQAEDVSDQLIVAYDTFGYRAIKWIEQQKKIGLKNVLFLEGGVIAWAHAKGQFIDDKGRPTSKVHVLNKAWALLPDSYEAISD